MSKIDGPPAPNKVVYNDVKHSYYMDGVRCKSVSKVAQIPTDTYTLESWAKRQVAIGMALDRNLCEKICVDPENKTLGDAVAEDAIKTAKAHLKADRGTQMHKVLELVLLDQPDRLLSEQQKADAALLQRTLDRYDLEPHDGMAEQFVAWPTQRIGGRFDCILRNRTSRRLVLTDLKSGPNAVAFPHSTAVQLALYARAPWMSDGIMVDGDTTTITDWRPMPEELDRRYGYVLLVPPDAEVGTLFEVDIEHGWAGAQMALQAVQWRKKGISYDKATRKPQHSWVREVLPADHRPVAGFTSYADLALIAQDIEELRTLWREAAGLNQIDTAFMAACETRKAQLEMAS
jgi:hypothetical protein